MIQRIAVVMLLFLSGCGLTQTANVTPLAPQATLAPLMNNVVVPLGAELSYIAPDPNARWTLVGQDLQAVDLFSTRIQIEYMLKPEDDTPFSTVLPTLTAASLDIQEADGVQYAEGTTPVSNYVLYVDKGAYVMTFTLIDAASDTIQEVYITDWRMMALEGHLVKME